MATLSQISAWYPDRWDERRVRLAVEKGCITQADYEEVVGVPYSDGEPNLESMTKHQLYLYAAAHGVTAYESWTKQQIIAAIQGAA